MREVESKRIVARWRPSEREETSLLGVHTDDTKVEDVGVVKLFEREGDGGRFLKAFLWENFETVLEQATARECKVELEFLP